MRCASLLAQIYGAIYCTGTLNFSRSLLRDSRAGNTGIAAAGGIFVQGDASMVGVVLLAHSSVSRCVLGSATQPAGDVSSTAGGAVIAARGLLRLDDSTIAECGFEDSMIPPSLTPADAAWGVYHSNVGAAAVAVMPGGTLACALATIVVPCEIANGSSPGYAVRAFAPTAIAGMRALTVTAPAHCSGAGANSVTPQSLTASLGPNLVLPLCTSALNDRLCGPEATCSHAPVVEGASVMSARCSCTQPNRPAVSAVSQTTLQSGLDAVTAIGTADPTLAPYSTGCFTPRVADGLSVGSLEGTTVVVRLSRGADGVDMTVSRVIMLVMKGTEAAPAFWSIDPATVPHWASTALSGFINSTNTTARWIINITSKGVPGASAPYRAYLNVTIRSTLTRTLQLPLYLLVSSRQSRPCPAGQMFYQGDCTSCPEHSICPEDSDLATIQLEYGYWRHSALSTEVIACRTARDGTSPCKGGAHAGALGEGYCADSTQLGPLCEQCDIDLYHDDETHTCSKCPASSEIARNAAILVVSILALLVLCVLIKLACRHPRRVARLVLTTEASQRLQTQLHCAHKMVPSSSKLWKLVPMLKVKRAGCEPTRMHHISLSNTRKAAAQVCTRRARVG